MVAKRDPFPVPEHPPSRVLRGHAPASMEEVLSPISSPWKMRPGVHIVSAERAVLRGKPGGHLRLRPRLQRAPDSGDDDDDGVDFAVTESHKSELPISPSAGSRRDMMQESSRARTHPESAATGGEDGRVMDRRELGVALRAIQHEVQAEVEKEERAARESEMDADALRRLFRQRKPQLAKWRPITSVDHMERAGWSTPHGRST